MVSSIGVVIRRATVDDLHRIELIERACFDESVRYERSLLTTLLEIDEFLTIIAYINEEPVGYASAYFHESSRQGRIISIAVLPEYRKIGVGTAMIDEIERNAIARGIVKVVLEVHMMNEVALRFYKKRGFSIKGILMDYYGPGKNAFTMEKFLRQSPKKNLNNRSFRELV
ncbi:MAG: N-acetyltransferase [Methanomassiliicoccales archaeon]|jgi:ribosomal-protein-alanine N-acetyltransferase|nr:N-acetyltransferase [Methanomassiliicoccales archaeon]